MQVCTNYDYEIIWVNDGSTDQSAKRLSQIAEENKNCLIINLRRNTGQTAAMMAGFDHCSGRSIVLIDGDLQNDPKDIPKLLKKLNEGYDL
ncbi:MAG: glycosyltransferase, partial [Kangiella sp.]